MFGINARLGIGYGLKRGRSVRRGRIRRCNASDLGATFMRTVADTLVAVGVKRIPLFSPSEAVIPALLLELL